MLRLVVKWLKTYPLTAGCVMLCTAAHVAVLIFQSVYPQQAQDALWKLGAIQTLAVIGMPNLHGPFDLWDGEIWRIPISAFHHVDLIHLVIYVLGTAYLGRLLEPRMSRWGFAIFILSSSVVSMLSELPAEAEVVGFSGVFYAMFGVLFVVRRRDEAVARQLTEGIVLICFAWLFLGVLLTYLELQRIASLAQFSGFLYGWAAGKLFFTARRRGIVRIGFYTAHLLLIPAIYLVVHPVWNGRYHWYLARNEADPTLKIAHWQAAVEWTPSLPEPWLALSAHYYDQGNRMRAWRTILQGLSYNRSYQEAVDLSRTIWDRFQTVDERQQAAVALERIFQEESDAWWKRLGIDVDRADDVAEVTESSHPDSVQRWFQQQFSGLWPNDGSEPLVPRDQRAPHVDPEAWYSALAGEPL